MMTTQEALKAAKAELAEEEFRKQVDVEKERLRQLRGRSLWERLFPWKITIERTRDV